MRKRINSVLLAVGTAVLLIAVGCKKGTFDINSPNPNQPSSVDPSFILSAAMNSTATIVAGNPGGGSQSGNDLFNIYMGYWAVSGDYIPSAALLQYKLTTDFGASIWDQAYPTLKNYKAIETFYGGDASGYNYEAIAKIMQALIYQRLVDIYNNIPYSEALQGGVNNTPAYDNAETVYKDLVSQLDSSVLLINSATATTKPVQNDLMFGGNMDAWKTFANTLKLKILMNLTQASGGPAYIQSELTGLTTADFIDATFGDATINPPYANDANNHQTPLWNDIGSSTTGTPTTNNAYFRANSYAVTFYQNTNDPRIALIYSPNSSGNIQGRAFGSTALEHNTEISGIGGPSKGKSPTPDGLLQSPAQPAIILSATQSLFLQAEAALPQNQFITADPAALYQSAIEESFRLLGVPDYVNAAATYTAQAGDNTNFVASSNPLKTIILQKWAALNTQDPLAAWDDWRRTGFPSDIPVSIYPGATATHIPYRLPYPTSEYNYNSANVNKEGQIDPLASKIFWMP